MTGHNIIVSLLACFIGGCSSPKLQHQPPLAKTASQQPALSPTYGSCDWGAKAIAECSTELKSTLTIEEGWVFVKVPACAKLETVFTGAINRGGGGNDYSQSSGISWMLADGKASLGQIHDTIVIRGEVVNHGFPWPKGHDVDVQTVLTCLVYPRYDN